MNLKRNYFKNPLKRGEYPEVEDIKYLFLDLNYSKEECAKICKCNVEKVKIVCRKNKLRKTKEQRTEQRRRTNLLKYGCINVSQNSSIKEKKKETTFKNYGVENPAQSRIVFNKIKETCLERYGVESSNSTQEKKQKIRETVLQKYNVDNVMKNDNIKQKLKNTCKQRYKVDNVLKNKQIKQKQEKTNLEKYGVKNLYGSKYFKEKAKETCLRKYGVDNIMKIFKTDNLNKEAQQIKQKIIENYPNIIDKNYKTKKKNNTFNVSLVEKQILNKLKKKFIVLTQYKSELYPFACDFYLPEIDLYIEYNGSWTHGGFPFVNNNICMEQLLNWQQKAETSDYYKNALETWTQRDVKKREIVKQNNLNWIEFFSFSEFLNWFEKQ